MTLLRYYKPINANVNNSKNKSLSESDENKLSLSETSLSEFLQRKQTKQMKRILKEVPKKKKNFNLVYQKEKQKRKLIKIDFKENDKEFLWLRYDPKEKKCTMDYVDFMVLIFPLLKAFYNYNDKNRKFFPTNF